MLLSRKKVNFVQIFSEIRITDLSQDMADWTTQKSTVLTKASFSIASFADVLWAFIPTHQRLLYGVWNSFPENRPITANFPYLRKLAFDLYDLRANVSINMAGIEVGFVNVSEKFGITVHLMTISEKLYHSVCK